MEQGKMTLKRIDMEYTVIDKDSYGYELLENNVFGEDDMIVLQRRYEIYTHTCESLHYTVEHRDEFTWYRLKNRKG